MKKQELEMYQLFKRNRVALMDPTYKPDLKYVNGKASINWISFDNRMKKYFTEKLLLQKMDMHTGRVTESLLKLLFFPLMYSASMEQEDGLM
jgi:hypothetical protein